MKIIVVSDSHMHYGALEEVIKLQKTADMFIHLGDGERDYKHLLRAYPKLAPRFHYIRGNCDYDPEYPITEVIDLNFGHRIFATHGHRLQIYSSPGTLAKLAQDNGCDIALYGHTHISQNIYYSGIYICNPGSLARPRDGKKPSYAVLDVSAAGVLINIVHLKHR